MKVMAQGKRGWFGSAAILVVGFAVTMLAVWSFILSQWSDLETLTPREADGAFVEALARIGGGPAYLVIAGPGGVEVRRELERAEPADLRTMHVLAWEPEGGRLFRARLPFWFVRAKMTDSINLGTLASALAGDWGNIDLKVSERDLERRGPGLVLDHTRADGARVLLWTE